MKVTALQRTEDYTEGTFDITAEDFTIGLHMPYTKCYWQATPRRLSVNWPEYKYKRLVCTWANVASL